MVNKITKRPYLFCPAGALHVFGRSSQFKRIYNTLVGNAIMNHANRMIAIPKEEKDFFYKLGVLQEKSVVIPNGISPEDFKYNGVVSFRKQYGLDENPFFLFMGRLNEIKGPDILLEAFISLAIEFETWQLVFAGPDGGMEDKLRKIASDRGLSDRIHFIGFISGETKSAAYHAAEILVIPSRLEAMSIVALEAAFCGTPVVMTDECGFSELVDAGGGVEVPVSSSKLAESLKRLALDAGIIFQMGLNAKKFISMNYTWEIAAKKHRSVCEEVIRNIGTERK
jgi:glycosyltransferase involved in cell wall biosynthesis